MSRAANAGRLGERLARRFLRKNGFRVLAKNYRTKSGEVDVVALDGGDLCFVEIKTRTSLEFGRGDEHIDRAKMRSIARVAGEFVSKRRLDGLSQRFDCVFVLLKERRRRGPAGWLRAPKADIELVRDSFTLDDIQ